MKLVLLYRNRKIVSRTQHDLKIDIRDDNVRQNTHIHKHIKPSNWIYIGNSTCFTFTEPHQVEIHRFRIAFIESTKIWFACNQYCRKRIHTQTHKRTHISAKLRFWIQSARNHLSRFAKSCDAKSSREKSQNEAKPSHNNGKAARAELRQERRTAYDWIESNNKRNSCTHKEKFQEQTAWATEKGK